MKVLLVTDDLLPGGISRHVVDLANGLHQKGIAITVAATDGKFRTFLNQRIQFIPLYLLKEDSFSKKFFGVIPSFFALTKLIRDTHFDIIHSHKRFSHFLLSMMQKGNTKHITSYHNVFKGKHLLSVFGECTICCSDAVKSMVLSQYNGIASNVVTVYNGIDPLAIHNEEQKRETFARLSLNPDARVIASVGQFIPAKDHETIIRSIKILYAHQQLENVMFVLLGFGQLKGRLENLVDYLGLREHIMFVDEMFNVEALFNISEFMILNPKHSEGFGIVMLEAASIGKIHIGTSVGGIPEFISAGETGVLVPPKDPKALATAILHLLDYPAENRRMGENAKRKFEKLFKVERMVEEIVSVYDNVCREKQ
ncbi:MAG: glycosyltransferase family 4 protein [Bacteroidota bacterium]|nr:glycosyltransferase family 4 protein [Bacteroidota bacterium]